MRHPRRSAYLARTELRAAYFAWIDANSRIAVAVAEARAQGITWDIIGDLLNMTRQGAQKRYGQVSSTPGATTVARIDDTQP